MQSLIIVASVHTIHICKSLKNKYLKRVRRNVVKITRLSPTVYVQLSCLYPIYLMYYTTPEVGAWKAIVQSGPTLGFSLPQMWLIFKSLEVCIFCGEINSFLFVFLYLYVYYLQLLGLDLSSSQLLSSFRNKLNQLQTLG